MAISNRPGIILLTVLILISSILAGCSSNEESPSPTTSPTQTSIKPDISVPVLELWTGNPVVQTLYGAVEGFEDESATWIWKAVPFAKPPVSELRWKAPEDPDSWEGVRGETDFCQMCSQLDWLNGESVWGSEDCLYLNIWRPQSEETNLPVYVWIHGGGNVIGSANQVPTYFGSTLARNSNMIFVSINYRLGPFAWFTLPALRTGESGDEVNDSGNYGTLDIIKALEWIQNNIEAFGGDPGSVLTAGSSSGGTDVLGLMASPLAGELFHRAAILGTELDFSSVEEGESTSREVLLTMLVNDGTADSLENAEVHLESMSATEIESCLRSKTPTDIILSYPYVEFGQIVNPNIFEDGHVIVSDGADAFEKGTYPNKVPIVMGHCDECLKMFLFTDAYFEGKDDLYQTISSYGSALRKAEHIDSLAGRMSAHPDQPGVYVYRFKWGAWKEDGSSPIPAPYDLKIGAAHSLDTSFFLGNPVFNVFMTSWVFNDENRPGRKALSDAIMAYMAEFARTGNPNRSDGSLPKWEPWTSDANEPKCILFDADLENHNIKMSEVEFTVTGVQEALKSEVPEPLYSQACEFMTSYRITSDLINDGAHSE